jgi:outer membrane protein TolC
MGWNLPKSTSLLSIIITSSLVSAQNMLTPEDAINIALNNNFGILVARNNAEIAKINNSIGAAGMLPSVALNTTGTLSKSNVNLEQSNNNKIVRSNGQATNINTGLALSWVLFDGGKMFITKHKLGILEKLGEYTYKDTVQQTVYNTIVAYYNVVSQKQQLISLNEAINYNKEQVKILQKSYDAGLVAKNNLLQAKIDLNVYLENAINQEFAITASKRILNQVLARDSDIQFDVLDTIVFASLPEKSSFIQKLDTSNINILSTQKQIQVLTLALKEYNATRLPRITLNAGYNLSQTDNNASNIIYNRSYGPTIGATLSIPIFQAGIINRQVATARLQLKNAEYNFGKIRLLVNTQLQNTLNQYDNLQRLLELEKENVMLAKENIDISIQRLRLGQTTSLEVFRAQESYVNSKTRLINFEYSLKISETKLKTLVAELK